VIANARYLRDGAEVERLARRPWANERRKLHWLAAAATLSPLESRRKPLCRPMATEQKTISIDKLCQLEVIMLLQKNAQATEKLTRACCPCPSCPPDLLRDFAGSTEQASGLPGIRDRLKLPLR